MDIASFLDGHSDLVTVGLIIIALVLIVVVAKIIVAIITKA